MDKILTSKIKLSRAQFLLKAAERRLAYLTKSIIKKKIALEASEIEGDALRKIKKLYESQIKEK